MAPYFPARASQLPSIIHRLGQVEERDNVNGRPAGPPPGRAWHSTRVGCNTMVPRIVWFHAAPIGSIGLSFSPVRTGLFLDCVSMWMTFHHFTILCVLLFFFCAFLFFTRELSDAHSYFELSSFFSTNVNE